MAGRRRATPVERHCPPGVPSGAGATDYRGDDSVRTYYEVRSGHEGTLDATTILTGCFESGARGILFDAGALPADFFDLSSGAAGELLHRLSVYGVAMAAVVPDPSRCSRPFQDFLREANRGRQFRFFPTREEATAWLDAAAAEDEPPR